MPIQLPIQSAGSICYCSGYKYQLQSDWWIMTPIKRIEVKIPGFVSLSYFGRLTILSGYAWDGPSGPTIDTRDFMRGSLVHDALYQLMREGLLNLSHRDTVDQLLVDLCREDGMSWWRARYVLWAVKKFALKAAERRDRKKYYAGIDLTTK